MRNKLLPIILAIAICAAALPVWAADGDVELIDSIEIKIPGCEATFSLENVNSQFGIIEYNSSTETTYYITFPGETGKVTCDSAAYIGIYNEFIGDDPSKSFASSGGSLLGSNWSQTYSFPDREGKGICIYEVYILSNGELEAEYYDIPYEHRIYFIMGYPAKYADTFYTAKGIEKSENLIKSNAVLHSFNDLSANDWSIAEKPERPSSWAVEQVYSAISTQLVPAHLRQNYKSSVSRGDIAEMLVMLIERTTGRKVYDFLESKGTTVNKNAFTDTSDPNVIAANALGLIHGVGDGRFDSHGTLTRAQIAAIVNRYAIQFGVNVSGYSHSFTDVRSHWVDSELGWAVHRGIINGVGNNKFDPDIYLTTEQAIVILYRAFTHSNEFPALVRQN